jgi:hypothetical protein
VAACLVGVEVVADVEVVVCFVDVAVSIGTVLVIGYGLMAFWLHSPSHASAKRCHRRN